jgi:uroporphyrinogen-III decarboxylase
MLEIYGQLLKNDVGEIFFISGPEFLGAPLGNLEQFRNLVTDYDKVLIDMIRQYEKKSILHCHGRIAGILEEIRIMNPDALQPIEPPPIGDCTLAEARAAFGEEMVLIGNIEYADLAARGPDEIEQAVAEAIAAGGPRNFILGPSCSPYEEQITERTAHNYIAMIKAGLKYGRLAVG